MDAALSWFRLSKDWLISALSELFSTLTLSFSPVSEGDRFGLEKVFEAKVGRGAALKGLGTVAAESEALLKRLVVVIGFEKRDDVVLGAFITPKILLEFETSKDCGLPNRVLAGLAKGVVDSCRGGEKDMSMSAELA